MNVRALTSGFILVLLVVLGVALQSDIATVQDTADCFTTAFVWLFILLLASLFAR